MLPNNWFRLMNAKNPSSRGRSFLAVLAERYGTVPQNGVYTTRFGFKMELDLSEYVERLIYYEAYEFLSSKVIRDYLGPGDIFIDIGANVGYYSLLAQQKVGVNGRVIAFEPYPKIIKKLKRNIALNGSPNIEIFEIALSNSVETVKLFSPKNHHSGETSMRNQGWDNPTSVNVVTGCLDNILPSDLQRVDCIKIDVEGAEKLVFEGASKVIQVHKPAILLEVNSRAAKSFGFDTLDALRIAIRLNPIYSIYEIASHSVTRSSLNHLEREFANGDRSTNLWLLP